MISPIVNILKKRGSPQENDLLYGMDLPSNLLRIIREVQSNKRDYPKHNNYINIGKGFKIVDYYKKEGKIPKINNLLIEDKIRGHHFGCLGASGSGKTSLIKQMVYQDICSGKNLLIIDPKGAIDLFAFIVEVAIQTNRVKDLLFVSPVYPEYSVKINLLHYYKLPDELVDHVTSGIKAKEEYFENVAYEVATAIILGLLTISKGKGIEEPQLNFHKIKEWCDYKHLEELRKNISFFVNHPDELISTAAKDVSLTLEQILSSPADFFGKVSSSLRTVLTALSISTTGKLIGKATDNEFIKRIENGEGVILFCSTANPLTRRTAHIFGKVLTSMVQSAVGRKYSIGETFNPPVCVYIDEGHNVLYKRIGDLFAQGREANVWIHFFTQSYAQIETEVGSDIATSITDNISTWCYMRVNHPDSARRIEDSSEYIKVNSKFYSIDSGDLTITIREDEKKVIETSDILHLPSRYFFLRYQGDFFKGKTHDLKEQMLKITFDNLFIQNELERERETGETNIEINSEVQELIMPEEHTL